MMVNTMKDGACVNNAVIVDEAMGVGNENKSGAGACNKDNKHGKDSTPIQRGLAPACMDARLPDRSTGPEHLPGDKG